MDWLTFSPDSQHIAWLEEGNLCLIDRKTWRTRILGLARAELGLSYRCLCFSPDGKRLAGLDTYGQLHCWAVDTGNKMLAPQEKTLSWRYRQPAMTWSPDGKTVAASLGPMLVFYDAATGEPQPDHFGHHDQVDSAVLSAGGKTLASLGLDETLCLWEAATGKFRHQVAATFSDHWPCKPLFSPDGNNVALTDSNGLICTFNAATATKQRSWLGPLLSDPNSGAGLIGLLAQASPCTPLGAASSITGSVEKTSEILQYSADGKILLTEQQSGHLVWWDVATAQPIRRFVPQGLLDSYDVDLAGDGFRFLTRTGKSFYRTLALWKPGRSRPFWKFTTPETAVFDPAGKYLALPNWHTSQNEWRAPDNSVLWVRLLEAHTGKERRVFRGPPSQFGISDLAFSPDGKMIACYSEGAVVSLWDVVSGQKLAEWTPHAAGCRFSFDASGKRLITAGADTTVLLWDVADLTKSTSLVAPPAVDLERLWADLAGADAAKAFDAMGALMANLQKALPFLKVRLRPVPTPDAKRVQQSLEALKSDQYAVREKATRELEQWGEAIESTLRAQLVPGISLEQRRRIELLLDGIEPLP
jgi:WD40 repeat protein